MLHARAGAELEPPPGLLETPAEVGVLGRAHALVEASDLLERGAAHHQVGGDGAGAIRMGEMGLLAEEALGSAVPCGERRDIRPWDDLPGKRADVIVDRLGEVRIE